MISLVAAYAHQQVIGKDQTMPWHLPSDLKYFKQLTVGKTIVMGRKTFASIGQPLPHRKNIVLTRSKQFQSSGIEVIHTKEAVLQLAQKEDIYVIGGAEIYQLFLDVANRLYLTLIDFEVEGDTFFPAWNPDEFELMEQREGIVDQQNPYRHTFVVYERKNAAQSMKYTNEPRY